MIDAENGTCCNFRTCTMLLDVEQHVSVNNSHLQRDVTKFIVAIQHGKRKEIIS